MQDGRKRDGSVGINLINMRRLKDLYIVLVDSGGNSALEMRVPVDSDEFRDLCQEAHPIERLYGEAVRGMEIRDEVDRGKAKARVERAVEP